ncbi:hypothetical protein [Nocardioides sp. KR10-350]|uniref:hypothetical protein n=1 Tax=Nocardioides cheoyonin TaxID=3156615 RepID=UPI0032B4296A
MNDQNLTSHRRPTVSGVLFVIAGLLALAALIVTLGDRPADADSGISASQARHMAKAIETNPAQLEAYSRSWAREIAREISDQHAKTGVWPAITTGQWDADIPGTTYGLEPYLRLADLVRTRDGFCFVVEERGSDDEVGAWAAYDSTAKEPVVASGTYTNGLPSAGWCPNRLASK